MSLNLDTAAIRELARDTTDGYWTDLPEEVDKDYIRIRGTNLGGRYKIANVLTPVYPGVHEREARQTRANAKWIAAMCPKTVLGLCDEIDRLRSKIARG